MTALGIANILKRSLTSQILLFLAAAALYLPSAMLARRLARGFEQLSPPDEDVLWAYIARVGARMSEQSAYSQIVNGGILLLGGLLAVIMGSVASGQWPILVRFWQQVPFGVADPIFGRDVSFFVFTLPFLRAAHSWLLGTFVLVATTTFSDVARSVGAHVDAVRKWRRRWCGTRGAALADLGIAARLGDAPRPGTPARIAPEQVARIVALACEAPGGSGRPVSQWSTAEPAEEIVRRGIVESISPRHAARLLKRGTSSRT